MALLKKLLMLVRAAWGRNRRVENLKGNIALPARVYNEQLRKIVILKLDHLGDFFLCVKAFSLLRQAWPLADMTLVCGPWNVALAEKLKFFDRIIPFEFFHEVSSRNARTHEPNYAAIAEIVTGEFDLAIDLRHDPDTRGFLDYLRAKYRAGYVAPDLKMPLDLGLPDVEPLWLNRKLALPAIHSTLHAETRLTLLASAIVDVFGPKGVHPIRNLVSHEFNELRFPDKSFAVVATGAGSPLRKWCLDRYADLCQRLVGDFGLKIVLIGGPHDRETNAALAENLKPTDWQDLSGVPVAVIPSVIFRAALFVGNDTGTTHLAALLDVPTVCLYAGISDPNVWQPVGREVAVVRAQTTCAPCRRAHTDYCRHENVCMSGIEVDAVMQEIQSLMQARSGR